MFLRRLEFEPSPKRDVHVPSRHLTVAVHDSSVSPSLKEALVSKLRPTTREDSAGVSQRTITIGRILAAFGQSPGPRRQAAPTPSEAVLTPK